MPTWTDQQRSHLLAKYRRSGLTQDAFCAELRSQGIDLSARTLRSWIARLEPPEGVAEECLQAVDQALSELRRVRAMLIAVRPSKDRETADPPPGLAESGDSTKTGMPDGTGLSTPLPVAPASTPVDFRSTIT